MRTKTVKELVGDKDFMRPVKVVYGENQTLRCHITVFRVGRSEDTEGKHLYDIRHADFDCHKPATIEPFVMVNWFGTLICDNPIKIPKQGFIQIKNLRYEDE